MIRTPIMIIGAGPIGLELAVALKRLGQDYLHLDARQIAHTISWYPKQVRFFSSADRIAISGVPLQVPDQAKASREEYMAYLRSIVQMFDLQIQTFEPVQNVQPRAQGGLMVTSEHEGQTRQYHADHVVLAIGDMHRPRMLNIAGEDLPHVSHYFDEAHDYFRRRLLIVGGRNSAVEAAIRCHRAGAQVALSYRQPAFDQRSVKYWLLPEIQTLIKTGQIKFYPSTVPTAITPTHVTLQDVQTKQSRDVAAQNVLALVGYEMDTTLFARAGAELGGPNHAPVFDAETMQTTVPGLYVAGTAAAGTQIRFRLFIENCHSHVGKIVKAITGKTIQTPDRTTGPTDALET